ncbi:DUF4127 family protein [Paenibacillus sp. DMB20]|uniref:DUF4127 family protein n=1 Tax=Paenibacillus sp. DMB20 TaxID=1642570 RepID=UPI0006281FEF|nr:DUF4127 family protein [Paenibacillus sp. DMB20]KKO54144.1 hypothetical protein XI25_08760 [Paenibacillus sp. DMB20]
MRKIIYIPLDERPCNYEFPALLAAGTDYHVVRPDLSMMGLKKRPGDIEQLWAWLFEQARDADGAIVALDTLLYGGIIPSRLHEMTEEQCGEQLEKLRQLKRINPALQVFAYQLIMRCPRYSSSDEEPDYYENWGREIFRRGYIRHRLELGIATEEEQNELQQIEGVLPESMWQDYTERRAVNLTANKRAIELVQDGAVDFMIIPQDDSAPYGLTAVDQQHVREHVKKCQQQLSVYMYPGADEVGCTLLARMINHFEGRKPRVHVHFASVQGPLVIPLYEDRVLYESVKYQIMAAGGLMSPSLAEADMALCINTPGESMMESNDQGQPYLGYQVYRNLVELIEMADDIVHRLGKPCVIADVAYANGADLELLQLLRDKKLLFELAGYAGWNTSGNTLGTCIAQGMIYAVYGNTPQHRDFLSLRYVEDGGYCAFVRRDVSDRVLPGTGYNYFSIDGQRGQIAERVRAELTRFIEQHLHNPENNYEIVIDDCYMPWSRMFEVGLKTHVRETKQGQ